MTKKLLLLAAMVLLVVCAFALSVSAEGIVANTITSDTYGTIYQLNADPGLEAAKGYVSTLNNIENQGKDTESLAIITDGTYYYVFPSSYLVDEYTNGKFSFTLTMGAGNNSSSKQKGINDALAEWESAEGVNLPTFEQTGTWKSTKLNTLIRFVVPTDVTYFDASHCLIKGDMLKEVVFTHAVSVGSGGGLFSGNVSLESVKGFELVTNFSKTSHTFSGCTSLGSIKLPSDTTAIGTEMFYKCSSFTGVENWDEIKGKVTSVGQNAFKECDSLVSISLPALTSIGSTAFGYCDNLETVDLIGASFIKLNAAFRNCPKLDGIVLPDTVDGISQDGFHGCSSLTSITIPRDCTSIGGYAFNGCSKLEVIDMSKATMLKSTGNNSFGGVIVKELHFPEGFETFGGISAYTLTSLTFPDSTKSLGVIKAGITEFRVPLGVTSLGNKTFDYCSSLTTVTLHKGLTSLVTGNNPSFFGTTLSNLKTIYYTGTEGDAFSELLKKAVPNATINYVDHCTTYYGSHAWSGNATMQRVDYFGAVTFADVCTRESCGVGEVDHSKTIGAMFTYLGYSYTEKAINGTYSMSQFYGIDRENIDKYEAAIGYKIGYGFVVSILENPIGNENATANNVIVAESNTFKLDYADIKVSGITEENTGKGLVFCMYVADGEEVYYLDGGVTSENVATKSYLDIVELKK